MDIDKNAHHMNIEKKYMEYYLIVIPLSLQTWFWLICYFFSMANR